MEVVMAFQSTITICWNGPRFEYLQDQTTCPTCGETGQQQPRRFNPGEREALLNRMKPSDDFKQGEERGYSKGYQQGFFAGVVAKETSS